jgi:glycolate oxidase iron-sulfur subunit
MTQIGGGTALPVVHTVELLDWAWGGPKPAALEGIRLPQPPQEASRSASTAL